MTISFVINGPLSISQTFEDDIEIAKTLVERTGNKTMDDILTKILDSMDKLQKATSVGEGAKTGVISNIYKKIQKSGGAVQAIVHASNKAFFNNKLGSEASGIIGILLAGLLYIFIGGILSIGRLRFFLENRLYKRTLATEIFHIYKVKKIRNAAGIITLKYLYLGLWLLTIVGLPIKYYSYYMVEPLFAENPDIPPKDIFKLSATLMKGAKFKVFLFDLSFILWHLLSIITFGIIKYVYLNPYIAAAKAELYAEIRREAIANEALNYQYMDDEPLFNEVTVSDTADPYYERYPAHLYRTPIASHRNWISVKPKERYSMLNLVLMFFMFAFIGWIWECFLAYIEHGAFINRGMLYGPWIPIYGFGGAVILLLTNRFNKKPLKTFLLTVLACAFIEYMTATVTLLTMHTVYWDYTGYFFNIQGRICLEGLIVFGLGGMMAIYFLGPITDNLLNKIPLSVRKGIAIGLAILFLADVTYAHFYPRSGKGLTYDN